MKDEVSHAPVDLKIRTRAFALRIIRLYMKLPKTTEAQLLGKQMFRAGTSVGAQYREACRAKSDADFISKIEGALQELEETAYWLELLRDASILLPENASSLLEETDQLIAIFVAMILKVKNRRLA